MKSSLYAFTILYNPALVCTKNAILQLYIRMSSTYPILRYASIFTATVITTAGVVLTFLSIFQCRPVAAGFSSEDGTCIDIVSLYLSSAPINILSDLAILFLPLPILTSLRLPRRQKIILVATFIVGGFVTIVDVVRISYLQTALRAELAIDPSATVTATSKPPNFTYQASFSLMWSAIEVNVGLMCACVLVLKPLVVRIWPSALGGHTRTDKLASSFMGPESERQGSSVPRRDSASQARVAKGGSEAGPLRSNPFGPTGLTSIPETEHDGDMGNFDMSAFFAGNGRSGDDDEDEDDGMDFFQMLSTDPVPLARKTSTMLEAAPPTSPLSHSWNTPSPKHVGGPSLPDLRGSAPPTVHSSVASNRPFTRASLRFSSLSKVFRASMPDEGPTQAPTQKFFDAVNLDSAVPLTQLTARQAWGPILYVSILFWLWGFAYGLLGALNGTIQALLDYDAQQTIALHNAYWLAYFFGPLVFGYYTLTRHGFKATFILGLTMYAIGAMAFWPSSVLRSYPGFFISNFLTALGLSCLEVAANPFIALAGPTHLSEARLNFSQGIQAIGSVVSPILANAFFINVSSQDSLFNVQWCYLAVALFVVGLAVIFYYLPLPEASAEDTKAIALAPLTNAGLHPDSPAWDLRRRVGVSIPLSSPELSKTVPRWRALVRAAFRHLASLDWILAPKARSVLLLTGGIMLFLYVGAQESLAYFWNPIIASSGDLNGAIGGLNAFNALSVGHAIFALGRFLSAFVLYMGFQGRHLLLFLLALGLLTSILSFTLTSPTAILTNLLLLFLAESGIFPTLFAMALRNQGTHAKLASTVLTMAISGGTVLPSIAYAVDLDAEANGRPRGARSTLSVGIGAYVIALLMMGGWYVTQTMRSWVDTRHRPGLSDQGNEMTIPELRMWDEKGASSQVEAVDASEGDLKRASSEKEGV